MEANLAPKVEALYQAIMELFGKGADLNNLTVAEIAKKAGIGKGTVYEYFDNKDEMIAEAIFYYTQNACKRMYEKLSRKKSLYERMNLLLVSMDEEMKDILCFIRALHVMVDNSAVSNKLREIVNTRRDNEILIANLVRKIIDAEITIDKEKEDDAAYLEMMAFSRIICYALYQFEAKSRIKIDANIMRNMICRDICRDVENFRGQKRRL